MDVTIDKHGRVEVGYADGCINACVTSNNEADNGRDAYATVARQSSGKTLLAAYDPKPNLQFSSVALTANGRQLTDTMRIVNWAAVAKNVRVRVIDGSRVVATTAAVTLQRGQAVTRKVTWTTTKGKHKVVSVVDPNNVVAESNENDNKRIKTITVR
jgi:subtilase family serine protease